MGDSVVEKLVIDTGLFREAGRSLNAAKAALEQAKDLSEEISDLIPQGDLAYTVREFADNWKQSRIKVIDSIGSLGESAVAIGETFEKADGELESVISGG